MRPSLGDKRRYITDPDVLKIVQIHKDFKKEKYSMIFELDDFAYRKVTIELEELDEEGNQLFEKKEVTVAQNALAQILKITPAQIKDLKDKKNTKQTSFSFDLKTNSDFVIKNRTKDKKIEVTKAVEGNKLKLTAFINVPVILKDTEIIPWKEDTTKWLNKEVEKKWTYIDEKKGYEVPFTREFYVYQPLRKLETVLEEFENIEKGNKKDGIVGNVELLNDLGLKL
jgi:type I restriction enzyme M protein